MRLADFRETLSHGVEFSRAVREPRAFRRKATFFMRLSLYRSGFFHLKPRVSSAFIHVIKRVISFRDVTSMIEKYTHACGCAIIPEM